MELSHNPKRTNREDEYVLTMGDYDNNAGTTIIPATIQLDIQLFRWCIARQAAERVARLTTPLPSQTHYLDLLAKSHPSGLRLVWSELLTTNLLEGLLDLGGLAIPLAQRALTAPQDEAVNISTRSLPLISRAPAQYKKLLTQQERLKSLVASDEIDGDPDVARLDDGEDLFVNDIIQTDKDDEEQS